VRPGMPALKEAGLMVLVSAGIVLGVAMIFRGAGAPAEPARAVMPGSAMLEFPEAGRHMVIAEQVISPRPVPGGRRDLPRLDLELTPNLRANIRGELVPLVEPSWTDWICKVLARGRGWTLGHVDIPTPGVYRLQGLPSPGAGDRGSGGSVVLAFSRPASPGRLLWLLLGFGGQIAFSARFLVQWLTSEKAGRCVIPRAFWYLSLFGGLMILAYAAYIRDPVFIAGYAPSSLIYIRNLVLLRREKADGAAGANGGRP